MKPLGTTRHNSLSRKDTKAMRKAGRKKDRQLEQAMYKMINELIMKRGKK